MGFPVLLRLTFKEGQALLYNVHIIGYSISGPVCCTQIEQHAFTNLQR